MEFLLSRLNRKREIVSKGRASLEDFYTDSTFLRPFALLQEEQLDKFIHGLFEESDPVYDKVYEKTDDKRLIKSIKRSSVHKPMYKMIRGFEEYTYLAAFEALLCGMFAWNNDIAGSFLEYGQGDFLMRMVLL